MAVRIRGACRIYDPQCYQIVELRAGQIVDGDLGVYLAANLAGNVEVIDAPTPSRMESPEASTPTVLRGTETSKPVFVADDLNFDPSAHTGPEVIAYANAHPGLRTALRAAEVAGRARTTVLAALS